MLVLTFFHYHHHYHDIYQYLYFHWKYITSESIKNFSLTSKSNPAFLKQIVFLLGIVPLLTFFNLFANMLYFKSECYNVKCSKRIFLNNTTGNEYLLIL